MSIVSHSLQARTAWFMALCVALLLPTTAAQATDVRTWKRAPIEIPLPVGTERIVTFDNPVRVGLPTGFTHTGKLRVQSTGGAIYLLARESFETQRIQIQDLRSGRIMLFDITGVETASHETIKVKISDALASTADPAEQPPAAEHKPVPPAAFGRDRAGGSSPIPVQLVRHAAQALYAPMRLLEGGTAMHRIAVPERSLEGLLPAYPVSARPVAAWRLAPYTVTAVEVVNNDPRRRFSLDPRSLAGDLYAASFMYDTIGPAGSQADTTTLFVVTQHSVLADALRLPMAAAESDDED